jgi:hypothetical protein
MFLRLYCVATRTAQMVHGGVIMRCAQHRFLAYVLAPNQRYCVPESGLCIMTIRTACL